MNDPKLILHRCAVAIKSLREVDRRSPLYLADYLLVVAFISLAVLALVISLTNSR